MGRLVFFGKNSVETMSRAKHAILPNDCKPTIPRTRIFLVLLGRLVFIKKTAVRIRSGRKGVKRAMLPNNCRPTPTKNPYFSLRSPAMALHERALRAQVVRMDGWVDGRTVIKSELQLSSFYIPLSSV